MDGPESAGFNDESIDEERLRRIARAADAGLGPAIVVLAEIYGLSKEDVVELQDLFRKVMEGDSDSDSQ